MLYQCNSLKVCQQNNENKSLDESKLLLEDFKVSIAELEMDELYSVDQSSGRKDDNWTAITMTGMDFGKLQGIKRRSGVNHYFLDTVSRPPRVLVLRLNKTLMKWFKNFMPERCRKFSRIFKRMKTLRKQVIKLMPKHEWQNE